MAGASPTVARWALARLLRERRERAGITGSKAAAHAGMHAGTLSKVESATTRIQPGNALLLMRYYGAPDDQCEAAFDLAHKSRLKGWWRSFKSTPEWFEAYLGLETEASVLCDYRAEWVHDLLQTEEYALHVTRSRHVSASEDEVQDQVALCLKRQQRLSSDDPLQLNLIMNESALRRQVGGASVMKDQLGKLLECAALSHVSCRILPFEAGEHAASSGSFTSMSFRARGHDGIAYEDVVYVSYDVGALYLEETADTDHYRAVFDDLRNRSLSEDESRALIERTLAAYE